MKDEKYEVSDDILELDDGSKYVVVQKFVYEGKEYFFTCGYVEGGYNVEDYQFFEIGEDDEGEYVEAVYDKGLEKTLIGCVVADFVEEDPELAKQVQAAAEILKNKDSK